MINSLPIRGRAQRRNRPSAFTLLEIIVCICILCILAALFLPVLKLSIRMSQQARCVTKLRHISSALFLYAADHDGWLPAAKDMSAGSWPKTDWNYAIRDYAQNIKGSTSTMLSQWCDGLYRCPEKKDWVLTGGTDAQRISYSMNAFTLVEGTGGGSVSVKLVNILFPQRTFLVGDSGSGHMAVFNSTFLRRRDSTPRHSGGDNIAFCDGHAEWIQDGRLTYDLILK